MGINDVWSDENQAGNNDEDPRTQAEIDQDFGYVGGGLYTSHDWGDGRHTVYDEDGQIVGRILREKLGYDWQTKDCIGVFAHGRETDIFFARLAVATAVDSEERRREIS